MPAGERPGGPARGFVALLTAMDAGLPDVHAVLAAVFDDIFGHPTTTGVAQVTDAMGAAVIVQDRLVHMLVEATGRDRVSVLAELGEWAAGI